MQELIIRADIKKNTRANIMLSFVKDFRQLKPEPASTMPAYKLCFLLSLSINAFINKTIEMMDAMDTIMNKIANAACLVVIFIFLSTRHASICLYFTHTDVLYRLGIVFVIY